MARGGVLELAGLCWLVAAVRGAAHGLTADKEVALRDPRPCNGLRCKEISSSVSDRTCGMWEGDAYLFQNDCDMAWFSCMSERQYKGVSSDYCGNEPPTKAPALPSTTTTTTTTTPSTTVAGVTMPTLPNLGPLPTVPDMKPSTGPTGGQPTLPSLTTAPCPWCGIFETTRNNNAPVQQNIIGSSSLPGNSINVNLGSSYMSASN